MPNQTARETLARQWELLKLLPSHRPGAIASELTRRLDEHGFPTTKRTVERDLIELQTIFPIACNDKARPYGWYWMAGRDAGIPGVELAEALSVTLLEQFLHAMLPLSLWRSFRPRLEHARDKLRALTQKNEAARWREKVRYVSPTLPVVPPAIDETVLEAVQRALLKDRQLEVLYRAAHDKAAKPLTLHPLGLMQRGPVAYLVATAYDYADIRYYAVHRMQRAEIGTESVQPPDGFNLDDYLAAGGGHFASEEPGETLRFEAHVVPDLARILEETPISKDTRLKEDGDTYRLTATVSDTWQLRWWILSQGPRIEVLEPRALRSEIAHELVNTTALYTGSGPS